MIHEGGRIASHAGFLPVSATVFAPIAIMQLMSMITGQYYMNGITKQLKSIEKKIDLLIKFHHTEKYARLLNARKILHMLCDVGNPSIEHLTQLKIIEIEIGAIYHEYLQYLEESKEAHNKIADDWYFSSKKSFNRLFSIDNDSNFSFNLYIVSIADEIIHLIPIIEFMINVKINNNENSRYKQINELYNKISCLNKDDLFVYSTGNKMLEDYYNKFIEWAEKFLKETCFYENESKKRLEEMKDRKRKLYLDVNESIETLNIKTKLVEHMTKPMEILYSIDEAGNNKVFIKQ